MVAQLKKLALYSKIRPTLFLKVITMNDNILRRSLYVKKCTENKKILVKLVV